MLTILLAMGFVNALNEAARDSDVFRMFARGQGAERTCTQHAPRRSVHPFYASRCATPIASRATGYKATVKCQIAFRYGALANFVAIAVAGHAYVGWEACQISIEPPASRPVAASR